MRVCPSGKSVDPKFLSSNDVLARNRIVKEYASIRELISALQPSVSPVPTRRRKSWCSVTLRRPAVRSCQVICMCFFHDSATQELIPLFAIYNRLSKRASSKTVETVRCRHFSASLAERSTRLLVWLLLLTYRETVTSNATRDSCVRGLSDANRRSCRRVSAFSCHAIRIARRGIECDRNA